MQFFFESIKFLERPETGWSKTHHICDIPCTCVSVTNWVVNVSKCYHLPGMLADMQCPAPVFQNAHLPHLSPAVWAEETNGTPLGLSFFIWKNGGDNSFPQKTLLSRKWVTLHKLIQKSKTAPWESVDSNLHTGINDNSNSNTISYQVSLCAIIHIFWFP